MKTMLSCLMLMTSLSAGAAIQQQKTQTRNSLEMAQEILSMPEENRKIVAKGKSELIYPALIALSKSADQSMETRWKALTLAAFIGKSKALKDIEGNLKSPEWFLRNAALISLHNYFPLKAKSAAQSLLKDKALVVRSAAVDVLSANLDHKTRDLLWEEFSAKYNYRKKQGLWIRSQILSQLAQAPLQTESDLFLNALEEKDSSLHSSAVAALEKITRKNLGKADQKVAERRALWLQWAKANSKFKVN